MSGRREDRRLLTGTGRFVDDALLAGAAVGVVVRSQQAHARITRLNVAPAADMPGVLGVLTGRDLEGARLGTIPCVSLPRRPDGSTLPIIEPPHHILAVDRVRYAGDAIAFVVAETTAIALNAAEAIEIDYEPLPHVTDTAAAALATAPRVWDDIPGNVSFRYEIGNRSAVEAALKTAHHISRARLLLSRVTAAPLENRNAIGIYHRGTNRYELHTGHQTPHQARSVLAHNIFRCAETDIRVVSPDVGGSFGLKGGLFREQILVLWAARHFGRPVSWTATRSESFLADDHARDNVTDATLALDRDGRFLAVGISTIANLGAYVALRGAHSPTNNLGSLSGVYVTPAIHAEVAGVFSNTAPTSSFRGAGRPEATYVLERMIDIAAFEMGIDRLELRRRNAIPPEAMPYKTSLLFTYDSGDFTRSMEIAARAAEWNTFGARRTASAGRGRLRGIGIANAIEQAGGPYGAPGEERADIRFAPDGNVTVLTGTASSGQGHETLFAGLVGSRLGIDPDRIRVLSGDTDISPFGRGTYGSRSAMTGGAAVALACDRVLERARLLAAHLMNVDVSTLTFEGGTFRSVATNEVIDIGSLATAGFRVHKVPDALRGGLDAAAVYAPREPTYPNGCHICEVEIDPDTGSVDIVRYTVADDVGTVLDHDAVEGQIRGGIAQGIGQAMLEEIRYEQSSGQLLSGSFLDYAMPRAAQVPDIAMTSLEVRSTTQPMGVKGAGEAGVVGALPAVISAIADALRLPHIDMPATPQRIWEALHQVRDTEGLTPPAR